MVFRFSFLFLSLSFAQGKVKIKFLICPDKFSVSLLTSEVVGATFVIVSRSSYGMSDDSPVRHETRNVILEGLTFLQKFACLIYTFESIEHNGEDICIVDVGFNMV